jgi:hypothetical protein
VRPNRDPRSADQAVGLRGAQGRSSAAEAGLDPIGLVLSGDGDQYVLSREGDERVLSGSGSGSGQLTRFDHDEYRPPR